MPIHGGLVGLVCGGHVQHDQVIVFMLNFRHYTIQNKIGSWYCKLQALNQHGDVLLISTTKIVKRMFNESLI